MGGCAPQSNVDALKAASRQFDIDTGQNPNYDAAHSMAQPGETLQDFFNQRSDWINSNMWNAEAAEKAGNLNTALTDLAQAMHTVEDAYSPMHMLGGPNGIPYVWDCSAPFAAISSTALNRDRISPGTITGGTV